MTPEFEHLVNALTVGESYFFRDQAQTGFLKDFFLPEIIEKKRKDQQKILRIWSAGCASGQEIYTIAILLNELLSDKYAWDV
ncbi:MAG: chemotaxis protein, partial [Gammaproteobacteria bacterium]|nr:chemotaxis protein [Gammaproteobacteria bacterium]